MKVAHVTFSSGGGAGIAARRGVDALRSGGVDAELFTATTAGWSARELRWRPRLDRLPLRLFPRRRIFSSWSNGWRASGVAEQINRHGADLVHLHWIGHGFLAWGELERIEAPMVWTLHDAWAFTGGCHYPGDCVRFEARCGRCPQLGSILERDLSRLNLRGREKILATVRRFIAPSEWLAGLGRRSGRVDPRRLRTVANALDLSVFVPGRRAAARARLRIAEDQFVIAVGSMELDEPRKGNHLLGGCLEEWRRRDPRTLARLLVFGGKALATARIAGLQVEAAGLLTREEEVADLLAAADVFLLPSLQDNLPNVAIEAQACGCPVVGYDAGGLAEIIEHGETGWLAEQATAEALGRTLAQYTPGWRARRGVLAEACRQNAVRKFTPARHAEAIRAIYTEILG